MQLSNLPDNETAFALRLRAPTTIDPARAEAACRAALWVDPANPTLMFQLGRALTLANMQLEAIKYYLEAADRRHAGSMNDPGEVYEYGVSVPKTLPTAIVWYERAAELGHTGAMTHTAERKWYRHPAGSCDRKVAVRKGGDARQCKLHEPSCQSAQAGGEPACCCELVSESSATRPCKRHEQSRRIQRRPV
jgi:TPR repeat protein